MRGFEVKFFVIVFLLTAIVIEVGDIPFLLSLMMYAFIGLLYGAAVVVDRWLAKDKDDG